jgi:ribonuclease HI
MLDKLLVYSDGGARGNPGPAGIGIIICDKDGNIRKEHKEFIGISTNNHAEYFAVWKALGMAKSIGKEVECFSDSRLIVNQLKGKFKVKNPKMREWVSKVKEREKMFRKVSYAHLPRTHPKMRRCDFLVNQILDRIKKKKVNTRDIRHIRSL